MGENEHGGNFVRREAQQDVENKQADKLIAANLSGGCWQDIEHVVYGIAKDGRAKRNREADGPEG